MDDRNAGRQDIQGRPTTHALRCCNFLATPDHTFKMAHLGHPTMHTWLYYNFQKLCTTCTVYIQSASSIHILLPPLACLSTTNYIVCNWILVLLLKFYLHSCDHNSLLWQNSSFLFQWISLTYNTHTRTHTVWEWLKWSRVVEVHCVVCWDVGS